MQTLEEALCLPKITTKTEQNLTPAEQQRQDRIDQLITLLFPKHKDMKTACQIIGISRTTGYEYFKTWQEQEESQLVDTEFWSLFRKVKRNDPTKALEILARIKAKKMAIKAEVKVESTHTENVNINVKSMLAEYEHIISSTGTQEATVPAHSSSEPVHSTQTNSEASPSPTNRQ
jgi:ACT domain-containing protein